MFGDGARDAELSVGLEGSAHLELHAVGIVEEQRPGRAEALDLADIASAVMSRSRMSLRIVEDGTAMP